MEQLIEWDIALFKALNGLYNAWLDPVMLFVTGKVFWIPIVLSMLYFFYRYYGWKGLAFGVGIALCFSLADQGTSSFMKPYFARLRPCHDPELMDWVRNLGNCGGQYGFASSHASNSFSIALFSFLALRHFTSKAWLYLVWAALVSYSRIYVGVHFPGDILVGACLGLLVAAFSYWISLKLLKIWPKKAT